MWPDFVHPQVQKEHAFTLANDREVNGYGLYYARVRFETCDRRDGSIWSTEIKNFVGGGWEIFSGAARRDMEWRPRRRDAAQGGGVGRIFRQKMNLGPRERREDARNRLQMVSGCVWCVCGALARVSALS